MEIYFKKSSLQCLWKNDSWSAFQSPGKFLPFLSQRLGTSTRVYHAQGSLIESPQMQKERLPKYVVVIKLEHM